MPTAVNAIGKLLLPLDAGALNTQIDDPVVTGILDYLAFWLRASLNPKLASLVGTSADAVPAINRFPWDPRSYFVRGRQDGHPSPFPALYCWWNGKSTLLPRSSLTDMRQRPIGFAWVFDELVLPGALEHRHGLLAAADATISSAVSLKYHPAYGINDGRVGTCVPVEIGLTGLGWRYDGGMPTLMAAIPGAGAANSGLASGRDTGHVNRAYPTLTGTIQVWEKIGQFFPADPGDVLQEVQTTIATNGEGSTDDAADIFERYLKAPDGTENP